MVESFLENERGQVSVEYLLIVAGALAIIAIAVFFTLTLFRKQQATQYDVQGLRRLTE